MIPELRQRYNAEFTGERYAAFLQQLATEYRWGPDFRVAESPLFLDEPTTRALVAASDEIVAQLATPAFRTHAAAAVPAALNVPRETDFPHFLCIDFALCHDAHGRVVPQLIELQGFPTVACFQAFLTRAFKAHFPAIPADFTSYLGGHDEAGYLTALRRAIIGDADPAETALLEITPDQQKTRIDFACTEAMLGIRAVDVSAVKRCRHRLYYERDGRETPIRRIYNRAIFDELLRKNPPMQFALTDDLDVEWAGHPNWYFRISKHTLPFLRNRFVPACRFVSDLLAAPSDVPDDLENYVLKPLYSFAGLGVDIAPTREKIAAVPNPAEWLLQRKVTYAPLLATPDGPAKAEVRLILVGDGSGWPRLVNLLVRLTKGAMHGVDFNKGRTWVGASAGFHHPLASF
jgi:hypothetical protein